MQETRPITIPDLAGVWRRTLFAAPGEAPDVSSSVHWLQLGALSGDIRAPAGAAVVATAFAGTLTSHGDRVRWTPAVALGDLTGGAPDEGRLDFRGEILREEGVHAPYVEHWLRIAFPDRRARAVTFGQDGTGHLIEIGPFGFCACPTGDSEAAFVLARQAGRIWRTLLSSSPDLPTGAPIDWPEVAGDGAITVPAGALGPARSFKVVRVVTGDGDAPQSSAQVTSAGAR